MIENISAYKKWDLKKLFLCHLLIAFLLGSYLFAKPVWHWVDLHFFQGINSTLEDRKWWQVFWAFANHRWADWVEDVMIILFFSIYISQAPKYFKLRRVAEFLFSIFFVAATIFCVKTTFDLWRLPSRSPSLIVDHCVRLSQELPWLKIKDQAARSFPGDHGVTAIMFGGCMLFFARKKLSLFACLYAAFLCMPRMMAGAHWLSDILVGSGSIALFALSWAFFSPLHSVCILKIESFLRFFGRFRLPQQN